MLLAMDRRGLLVCACLIASASTTLGCSSVAQPARNEDVSRQNAPVPACIVPMPVKPRSAGTLKRLQELQYWELVFPSYDAINRKLPEGAPVCTGQQVLRDPIFEGGTSDRGWPRTVEEGDALVGSGGDRLKVVWLRSHTFQDKSVGGAIALVRTQEDYAEAYAIGAYRSTTPKPYLMLERMGPEVAITAQDDQCLAVQKAPCETRMTVFLPRNGVLKPLASFALKKRDFVVASEPGSFGSRIEYRLTAAPKFSEEGIKLYEQVLAIDEGGRELRRAEVERFYKFQRRELSESEGSLWPRIFPRKDAPATPAAGGKGAAKITLVHTKDEARALKAELE